jgi:hydrogenase maturation protease
MNVLVAGVGYTNLRDLSVGPTMVGLLRQLDWQPGVEIEDLSYGPIAVAQRLQEAPGYYDRIVLVSAAERGDVPGTVRCYQWNASLPSEDEIQRRVGEAIGGVVSLDNLLVVAQHLGALPPDVRVIEVEPQDTGWGPGFTPEVQAALPRVLENVRKAVTD